MFKKGQLLRGRITERRVVVVAWPVVRFVDGMREVIALTQSASPCWRLIGNNYKEKPRD